MGVSFNDPASAPGLLALPHPRDWLLHAGSGVLSARAPGLPRSRSVGRVCDVSQCGTALLLVLPVQYHLLEEVLYRLYNLGGFLLHSTVGNSYTVYF